MKLVRIVAHVLGCLASGGMLGGWGALLGLARRRTPSTADPLWIATASWILAE